MATVCCQKLTQIYNPTAGTVLCLPLPLPLPDSDACLLAVRPSVRQYFGRLVGQSGSQSVTQCHQIVAATGQRQTELGQVC